MKIQRSGSEKYHGETTLIRERTPEVEWRRQALVMKVEDVRDVHQPCHYNYKVILNHEDIVSLIKVYAVDALKLNPKQVHEALSECLFYLQQLFFCALGYDVNQFKRLAE